MPTKRKTLLEKYDIPISYLDFGYVEKCSSFREMEKIVNILRSGEEGYYPDLTKAAEEKLRKLKPDSKLFRTEENLLNKNLLTTSEWEAETAPIFEWFTDVKNVDKELQKMKTDSSDEIPETVAKKTEKIVLGENTKKEHVSTNSIAENRLKSTDYSAWDKFDADSEILKIELEEEKTKEEQERKNRKTSQTPPDNVKDIDFNMDSLTMIEREKLAISFKERGNDYFRAKEFESSLKEYTRSIKIFPTSTAYNNRAITNIKLKNYRHALEDTKKCLEKDPKNVKALFRKAESLLGLNKNIDAMDTYLDIMEIEPSNVHALKAYNDLSSQNPSNRKATGTRLKIADIELKKKEEDYAELIKPVKIVKNQFLTSIQNLSRTVPESKSKVGGHLDMNLKLDENKSNNVLIEEI